MSIDARTGKSYWPAGATQQDILFNEWMDYLVYSGFRPTVLDKDLNTPPAHVAGAAYILPTSPAPTGDWFGKGGKVARSDGTSWRFFTPSEGFQVFVLDENVPYTHDGLTWQPGTSTTFTGGSLTSAINEAKGADIASSASIDIGAATGNLVHITGTTTITSLGTVQAGTRRELVFDGALTLTHNATSLILPTGANITTTAGDCATFISEGAGNWRCTDYQRKDGSSLVATAFSGALVKRTTNQTFATSTVAAITWSSAEYQQTDTWWSAGNPTRLTVPAGVTRIRITAQATFAANATGVRGVALQKNGSYPFVAAPRAFENAAPATFDHSIIAQTGVLVVTPGDYFEVIAQQTSGGNLDIVGAASTLTWAAIEAVR